MQGEKLGLWSGCAQKKSDQSKDEREVLQEGLYTTRLAVVNSVICSARSEI